jgi:hypothetical protein
VAGSDGSVGAAALGAAPQWGQDAGAVVGAGERGSEEGQEKEKKRKRKLRPINTLSNPRDILDEALYRQGFNEGDRYPTGFKEKWSENGYDYEVRIHQPPPNAPAGSNSANGPTYRIARRK